MKYLVSPLAVVLSTPYALSWSPSMRSSFMGTPNFNAFPNSRASGLVMYDASPDQPLNAWSVLTRTEEWISQTLSDAQGNPYTRKEVSYVCETNAQGPLILSGIFRRLKEARLLGESHGEGEEERRLSDRKAYRPHTLRKTEVVVIPTNTAFSESFPLFDAFIEAINQARRNARDYITDDALEKNEVRLMQDDDDEEDEPRDWSVSVNCAHLHPKYGQLSSKQQLQQMKQEEEGQEVDLNYKEYMEKRQMARRSPYPTIVIEVRSTPPPDFTRSPPSSATYSQQKENSVTAKDIQRLEAIFGRSAHTSHPSKEMSPEQEEDAFYQAIGESIEQQFISVKNPFILSQEWISRNDPTVSETSAFTESDTGDVDAAYEFVAVNLAMLAEPSAASAVHYLVMPRFLSSAATSFEKFAREFEKIVTHLPDANVKLSTFHPEHIDRDRRSPFPILKMEWQR
ncbi:hypothetical protein FisN_16Lh160 [Fistulifera solaris]|uniref:Uncharacterized protein n=1 Tax=Fistulifera solaris TaxID=1519565 RepID=A0A1Z5KJV2_FISSO|nr:hypothetical protein FisN_16Lh160 [Fistulifera solaris]|eukprot:GAX26321.1 hypothetical protein FisN_16Lh160 [Fistulifera solaris]